MKKNKKGFTLIEVMATIVILAIILVIAVPIYNGVSEKINESIYQSKIDEVIAKAESYAGENHTFVFNIKTLIEAGLIHSDNETGAYVDPRTGRDMRCDILNALYKDNRYEISITESEICYDLDELENLYGMITLKLYDQEGKEISKISDTEWIKNETLYVKYEFKEEYQDYANSIQNVVWIGEQEKSCTAENLSDCDSYLIQTTEIKNVTVGLQVTVNIEGIEIMSSASKTILIDLQAPAVLDGSILVNNDISTNNERRVEFEISDGSGSGIKSYSVVQEKTCSGQEYEKNKQIASDGIQSIYLTNGNYYICVEDKVGNKTSDSELENVKNQITVSNVDSSNPEITRFVIRSKNSQYNTLQTTLSIEAKDDGGTNNLEMCISNTGYLQGCSWEKYAASKNWNLPGSLDGTERIVYVSVRDKAGNVVNREAKYTVYKNCRDTAKSYTNNWPTSCPVTCGSGVIYRNYQMKDIHTGTVCKTGRDSKTCSGPSCTTRIDFNAESDINNNFSKGYYNSDRFTDEPATLRVSNGNAYFYEPSYDTFSHMTLHYKNQGLKSLKFRMQLNQTTKKYSYCLNSYFWVPHFQLIFSDGGTIRFYPSVRITGKNYYSYNPWREIAGNMTEVSGSGHSIYDSFYVFNYLNNTKQVLGARLTNTQYYEYSVTVDDNNNLTLSVGNITYTTNIGSRKLVSVYFNPLSNWCGTGTTANIDWLEYTVKE